MSRIHQSIQITIPVTGERFQMKILQCDVILSFKYKSFVLRLMFIKYCMKNHGELGTSPNQPLPSQTHFDANSASSRTHPYQVDLFSYLLFMYASYINIV